MIRASCIETVAARYGEALALAGALGMRPLAAHRHFGLGRAHRRAGRHEAARTHVATACTLYRELGMTRWLGPAERELGEAGWATG